MATKLTEGVWRLDLGGVNAYLVEDGTELVLIDAGETGDGEDIIADVTDAGHDIVDVDRVLITHFDPGHVGGLAGMTPDLDAPVVLREPDASYLAGSEKPPFTSLKGALQRILGAGLTPPDLRVERIIDGEEAGSFTAYHTPGHTRGHMAYVSQAHGVAMLGDLVRESGGDLAPPAWYRNHDTGALKESVRKLGSRAPEFEVACPGHGDPITEGGSDELVRLARQE